MEKEHTIKLTDIERRLLLETVDTSTYAGKLSDIVSSIRSKLKVEEDG